MAKIKHKVTGEIIICDDFINARDNYGLFVIKIDDLIKNYDIIKAQK